MANAFCYVLALLRFVEASYFTALLHSEGEREGHCLASGHCWQEKTSAEFGFGGKFGGDTGTRDARNGKLTGSSKNLNPFIPMDVFL